VSSVSQKPPGRKKTCSNQYGLEQTGDRLLSRSKSIAAFQAGQHYLIATQKAGREIPAAFFGVNIARAAAQTMYGFLMV
jgi:hypothetical protein